MARAPTGHVEWHGTDATGRWRTRATNAAGKREWINLPATLRKTDEVRAKRVALGLQAAARLSSHDPPPPEPAAGGESVEEYGLRWIAERRRIGRANADRDEGNLRRYLYARLGARPMTSIVRADLDALVERLDDAVLAGELGWKTASNVWALIRKLFDDAASAKRATFRVLDASPARDVGAPDRGRRKAKQFLWPSELLALVSCEAVPVAWRRICAASVYLGLRAGELSGLRVEDLDQTRWLVRITEAVSTTGRRRLNRKAPKTEAGTRTFAAEPAIRLLLEQLCRERKTGPLFEAFRTDGPDGAAPRLRDYLTRAGVTRPELHETTATRKAMTFHDMRATYCTWCAIRGDDPMKIRARAGHEDIKTTMGYVRVAELLDRALVGDVFPVLPLASLAVDSSPHSSPVETGGAETPTGKANDERPQRESNPQRDPHGPVETRESAESSSNGPSVGGAGEGGSSPQGTMAGTDPDAALRAALSAAVGAGDLGLAEQLLRLLRSREPAPAVSLDARRRHG